MGISGAKVTIKTCFRDARQAIKTGSNQEKVENVLLDSIRQDHVSAEVRAEGYYLAALLQQSVNEGLNQKAYLKQNLDTVKLFSTVLKMYQHVLSCDSNDTRKKFSKDCQTIVRRHRPNLLGGGKFLLRKEKWSDAYQYFDMFLGTSTTEPDSLLSQISYWATVCANNTQQYHLVLKNVDRAMQYCSQELETSLAEYKSRSYLALGDTAQWVETLKEGSLKYLGHRYFFLNYIDYLIQVDQMENAVQFTDSLLQIDQDRAIYWYAKSQLALEMGDYEKAVTLCDQCLHRSNGYTDALFNKGAALCNLALAAPTTAGRSEYYRQAMVCMEAVREAYPEAIQKWGTPLYRIYMYLNMGDKFDEIDQLLHNHN